MSKHEEQRIEWLALVQIICTVLIVLSHSVVVGIDYPACLEKAVRSIQIVGLTAFMWCSGYLVIRTNSVAKYGYKTYIKKRFVRLMTPYFVVQLLMLIPKIIIGNLLDASYIFSIKDFICGFINPRNGVLPHLWFLPVLMILTLVSPLLVKYTKNKLGAIVILGFGFILAIMPQIPNILCLNDVTHYFLWYSLGIVVAQNTEETSVQNEKSFYYVLAIIVSVPIYFIVMKIIPITILSEVVRSIFSLIILVSIGVLINKGNVCAKLTFPIYILSLPIQNFAEIILRKLQSNYIFATIFMFLIGIAIPVVIAIMVSKIEQNRKILSRIIGL